MVSLKKTPINYFQVFKFLVYFELEHPKKELNR